MSWDNTSINDLSIHRSWSEFLCTEQQKQYFSNLHTFIEKEKEIYMPDMDIYPAPNHVYNAFGHCTLDDLKVCILGQDPYHGKGQAMGLCFSVPENITPPPSLKNIFKELKSDCNINIPKHGDLTSWAKQGVLLLNTSLTVRQSCPNSHTKYWLPFTDNLIKYISQNKENIIFILWGSNAKNKKKLINLNKHHILEANHPSPLSANRGGFFNCCHFSKTNSILTKLNKPLIDWSL